MEIYEFNDIEEAIAAMQQAEEAANELVTPEQAAITWGSYWARWHEIYGQRLALFGYVMTREEARSSSLAAGADEEEAQWEDERLVEAHERGYRYGRVHSVIVPEGELGSTHVSTMFRELTAEQFRQASEYRWGARLMAEGGIEWAAELVASTPM